MARNVLKAYLFGVVGSAHVFFLNRSMKRTRSIHLLAALVCLAMLMERVAFPQQGQGRPPPNSSENGEAANKNVPALVIAVRHRPTPDVRCKAYGEGLPCRNRTYSTAAFSAADKPEKSVEIPVNESGKLRGELKKIVPDMAGAEVFGERKSKDGTGYPSWNKTESWHKKQS